MSVVEANEWSLDLLDSFYSSSKTLEEIRTEITPSKYRPPIHPIEAKPVMSRNWIDGRPVSQSVDDSRHEHDYQAARS